MTSERLLILIETEMATMMMESIVRMAPIDAILKAMEELYSSRTLVQREDIEIYSTRQKNIALVTLKF